VGREMPPSYYGKQVDKYSLKYSESPYFLIWKRIIQCIPGTASRIIDLGCGNGQFAQMLKDLGYTKYVGVDFAKPHIQSAKKRGLPFEFIHSNFYTVERISDYTQYDVVILSEVLEHIERDLEVLEKIDDGKIVIFSVPNFDCENHVRHFHSPQEVISRYSQSLDISKVHEIKMKNTIFVVNSRKGRRTEIIGDRVVLEPGVVLGNSSIDVRNSAVLPQTGKVIIGDNVRIGSNTSIARGRDMRTPTVIRNNVVIGPNCLIGHGCQISKNVLIHGGAKLAGFVEVGQGARLGMGCMIRNRVKIGPGSVVGIGAVVVKDVPPKVVVVGNPARVLRNVEPEDRR